MPAFSNMGHMELTLNPIKCLILSVTLWALKLI
jgi:hypothetical protein